MEWLLIIILGTIQGITEFLPISSDGHLAVAEEILTTLTGHKFPDNLTLNIIMHAGTLFSIIFVYWHRIWRLVINDRRVILLLIVGTIPAIIIGLPAKRFAGDWLTDSLLAGLMLPLTGLVLIWGASYPPRETDYCELTFRKAFLIGIFQAIAILPGISRSGMTISSGLMLGLRRDAAATFSFLLALPAIAGAVTLELIDLSRKGGGDSQPLLLVTSAIVAFVVGVVALKWLLKWLESGKLHYFAYWCIPFGIAVSGWQIWIRFGAGVYFANLKP